VPLPVSIHAPLTGGDAYPVGTVLRIDVSIHAPSREATNCVCCIISSVYVSIHAPLTGGDPSNYFTVEYELGFNPRPPHGRRRGDTGIARGAKGFNPRPPHGRRRG